ncbi:MAG: SDR family oxidoreductase [Burkholderiales bacterium]
MGKLDGKFAVVTGGNSGIGLAAALALAQEGARIAILGRDARTLDAAASTIGKGTIAVQGDVANMADLDRLYAAAGAAGLKIDALFVNAGMARFAPMEQVSEAMFDELFAVNVKGAYFTVQKALPHLQDGAAIVFNSSVTWHQGLAGASIYSATKAALIGLTKSLAGELAPRKIRVNAISPGVVHTPIVGRLGMPLEHAQGFQKMMAENTPLKRGAEAGEVGRVVRFLCSDDSSYITGTEIPVDGGYLLGMLP